MRLLFSSLIAMACFAACGGDESSQATCIVGEQRACKCAGGLLGAQICNKDGRGYGACFGCSDAGVTGGKGGTGGGAGGSGGTSSGGGAGSGGTSGKRTGIVKLDGRSLSDDQGRFNALGATLMWAAWGFKNDKARLEQNLDFLAKHGFHYFRALGVVGDPVNPDFWDGREIDWRWPDYADVIAGLTDLAFDQYGLRVEWTLIGDGEFNIPDSTDRQNLVNTFVAMAAGREQKIMHFEIANEAWQNGFDGAAGITELRALTQSMKDKTEILVAASAPASGDCAGAQDIYGGGISDIATIHFDRDISQIEGHWRPVWQPWWPYDCQPALPVVSNNEPIGPGSSVNSESDPLTLASSAVSSWVSGVPFHVFHSKAGVRGDVNLWEMPGSDAFQNLAAFVPPDLASWTRKDPKQSDAPIRIYAEVGGQLVADTTWSEVSGATSGVVRAYGAVNGQSFFVVPIGILGSATIEARQAMSFDVIDPLTGASVDSRSLASGEKTTLSGAGAFVLKGSLK